MMKTAVASLIFICASIGYTDCAQIYQTAVASAEAKEAAAKEIQFKPLVPVKIEDSLTAVNYMLVWTGAIVHGSSIYVWRNIRDPFGKEKAALEIQSSNLKKGLALIKEAPSQQGSDFLALVQQLNVQAQNGKKPRTPFGASEISAALVEANLNGDLCLKGQPTPAEVLPVLVEHLADLREKSETMDSLTDLIIGGQAAIKDLNSQIAKYEKDKNDDSFWAVINASNMANNPFKSGYGRVIYSVLAGSSILASTGDYASKSYTIEELKTRVSVEQYFIDLLIERRNRLAARS